MYSSFQVLTGSLDSQAGSVSPLIYVRCPERCALVQVLEVLYGLRLDEAIMTEAKQPERGVGGGRVRRKKGGRKAAAAGRGEAKVNAGAVLTALLRPHGRHGCIAAHYGSRNTRCHCS